MWKNIIGQHSVKEQLKSIYVSGKISHAYLFEGLEGTGKDAAAIEFIKLLNCKNPLNNIEACDECINCKKIDSFRFEYFYFICALPSGKSDDTDSDPLSKLDKSDYDEYIDQIQKKSENPYFKINIKNANNIRISSIRYLLSKLYLTSPAGYIKAALISDAEKMRQEAANALLKILEEPPKQSIIILTTSKVNSLPQTITGRCQRLHFNALSSKEIEEVFNKEGNFSQLQVKLASRLSFGSYSRAYDLLTQGIEEIREKALEYLIAVLMNDYAKLVQISRKITESNDKIKTKQFLFFLNIWVRDLTRVKAQGKAIKDELINYDLSERLEKLNRNYPESDVYNIILELEEAEKMLSQNVNLTLILINMSFNIRKLFNKKA